FATDTLFRSASSAERKLTAMPVRRDSSRSERLRASRNRFSRGARSRESMPRPFQRTCVRYIEHYHSGDGNPFSCCDVLPEPESGTNPTRKRGIPRLRVGLVHNRHGGSFWVRTREFFVSFTPRDGYSSPKKSLPSNV